MYSSIPVDHILHIVNLKSSTGRLLSKTHYLWTYQGQYFNPNVFNVFF